MNSSNMISTIFTNINEDAKQFYLENGYCQFRIKNNAHMDLVLKNFTYYSDLSKISNPKTAFNNSNGVPRHYQDIFRDSKSFAYNLYQSDLLKSIYQLFFDNNERLVSTHSKLSFKSPGEQSSWHPHQDNGYKKKPLNGLAIFIPLENMDESNGCLEVYPGSHKYGAIPHSYVNMDPASKDGDYQVVIDQIPDELKIKFVKANQGDIIVFSLDTIHQSGVSKTNSARLALITEVEPYGEYFIDDYSMRPLFLRGKKSILDDLRYLLNKTKFALKN